MDTKRKKELLQAYKERKPEMGLISFHCISTGDNFIMGSKDTKADLNSKRFQLEMGNSYNHPLQALWNEYGRDNFEICVLEVLPYGKDETKKDYSEELELLCCCYLEKDEKARRLK